MSITSISAAGLSQYVLQASNSTQQKQALQTLQNSLASGDLNGAQSAFQTLQTLYQNAATASGTSLSSQLSTDLTALGSALTSGDLSTAQSAFATLQSDLKTSSPSLPNETNAASRSVQLVDELLSTLTPTASSSTSDSANSLLQSVYAGRSLNVLA